MAASACWAWHSSTIEPSPILITALGKARSLWRVLRRPPLLVETMGWPTARRCEGHAPRNRAASGSSRAGADRRFRSAISAVRDVYFAMASDRHDLSATMVAPRLMASRLQTASEAYAPLACEIVGGLLTLVILTVLVVPAVCGPEGQLWSTAARISNCDSSAGSIRTRCDCDRNGF